jgi:hypothetical protein
MRIGAGAQIDGKNWGVVVGEPNSNDDSNLRCFLCFKVRRIY